MMMKRLLSLVLALTMMLFQVSCGNSGTESRLMHDLTPDDLLKYPSDAPVFEFTQIPWLSFWNNDPVYYGHEIVTETETEITIHRHLGVMDFSFERMLGEFEENVVIKKKPEEEGEEPDDQNPDEEEPPESPRPTPDNDLPVPTPVDLPRGDDAAPREPGPLGSSGAAGSASGSVFMSIVGAIGSLFGSSREEEEFDVYEIQIYRGDTSRMIARENLKEQKRFAEAQSELEASAEDFRREHNRLIDETLSAGPSSLQDTTDERPDFDFQTPKESPYFDSLLTAKAALEQVRSENQIEAAPILDRAENALKRADAFYSQNDFTRGQLRMRSFQNRLAAAMNPFAIPQSPGAGPRDARTVRYESYQASLEVMDAADGLDEEGDHLLADIVNASADTYLNVGLGLTRLSGLADIPLSAMEAFTGKTVDFERGKPVIRETTTFERAAAVVSLGLTAAGVVLAGPGGAAAGAYIGKLGKQMMKSAAKWGDEAVEVAEDSAKLADDVLESAKDIGLSQPDRVKQLAESIQDSGIPSDKVKETLTNIGKSDDFARAVAATPANRPMFYVNSAGEAIPSTGYKYIDTNSAELGVIKSTGSLPARSVERPHYMTFDNFDDSATAIDRLQVPSQFNDGRYKVTFDTLQTVDELKVPNGRWGEADYLEPMTNDFPEFGQGGASQAVYTKPIKVQEVRDLSTGEIVYKAD